MSVETKSIELVALSGGHLVEVHITGKLSKEDYEEFVPVIERHMETHGKLRMLVSLEDFHGWTAGAVWEDVKFDAKHFNDIERLAIVGESRWESGMSVFCRPFTTAKVRYFSRERLAEAREWLEADADA